jgi:hypothetical protein
VQVRAGPNEAIIIEGNLRIEGGTLAFGELSVTRSSVCDHRSQRFNGARDPWEPATLACACRMTCRSLAWMISTAASKVTPALTTIALPRLAGQLAMQIMLNMLSSHLFKYSPREFQPDWCSEILTRMLRMVYLNLIKEVIESS